MLVHFAFFFTYLCYFIALNIYFSDKTFRYLANIISLILLRVGWFCTCMELVCPRYSMVYYGTRYSHTLCCGFHIWDVYRYQPISHSSCRFSTMYGSDMSYVTWSCEKIQTLFIFRAICENTAHVQWIRYSPKGSLLFHWTSAVFPHIALR